MSVDWVAEAPAFAALFALLILPGMPMALLLRLRGVLVGGAAIAGSLASVAGAAVLSPILGWRWSILPVAVVATVITLIAATVWVAGRRHALPVQNAEGRLPWLGIGLGLIGWMLIVMLGINDASHPTQLYDGIFHLNAVEFIVQTGDASPFHMTMVTPGTETAFYPTLWHSIVSLIVPLSTGIVPATNVASAGTIAVIWPVALAVLTSVLFPGNRRAVTFAPLVAFGFSVFPLGFLNWGVLYPNLLGTLLIPLVLAFALTACSPEIPRIQRLGLTLLVIATAGAAALAHPSALLGAIALLVPFALWRGWRSWASSDTKGRALISVVCLAGLAGLVALWIRANVTTHEWLPGATLAQALGEVAFLSPVGRVTGLLIGPAAAIGIWSIFRKGKWWVLWSYAVSIGLFLAATWLPNLSMRSALVGVWYDDTTRVAALLGVLGLPLAALGAATVMEWLARLRRRGCGRRATSFLVVLLVLAATHLNAIQNDISFMRKVSFRFDGESQGLSADEAELFDRADQLLDSSSLVIGNPLTGAALLYAYTGHDVVFPHVTGRYGAAAARLARSFNIGSAATCAAAAQLGVTHALDFGDRELFENHYTKYDGLHNLGDSAIVTEVARVGDAALYEITGCH